MTHNSRNVEMSDRNLFLVVQINYRKYYFIITQTDGIRVER